MTACMLPTRSFICRTFTRESRVLSGFCAPSGICDARITALPRSLNLMIVDCHCHAGKGDLLTAPWNTDASVDAYLRRAKAAGIAKTIVFAPFHSDYSQANAEVARITRQHPTRLIGFAF